MRIPALTLAAALLLAHAPAAFAYHDDPSAYGTYDSSDSMATQDATHSQDTYWWMYSDMWSDQYDVWLGTDVVAETTLTMDEDAHAVARSFSQIGSEYQLSHSAGTATAFSGLDFDVRAYVSHSCFDVQGASEMENCTQRFGRFADLSDTWESGQLSTILADYYNLAPGDAILADWHAGIQQELALREAQMEADVTLDAAAVTSADIRVRSDYVWNLCADRYAETEDQNFCFQQNMRLIQRTDMSLDHVNLDLQR